MRVKAVIEYRGSAYAGWQIQPGVPTVQGELEEAIRVATGRVVRVEGAGRTDAGVHAEGQVAAFDLDDDTDLHRLLAALNGITGDAVAVRSLERADDGFDPRRHASRRVYRYTVVHGRPRSPLLDDRAWHVPTTLDPALLGRLADRVVGRHDFRAFRASDCEAETTTRTVMSSAWSESPSVLTYEIAADAFLKHMVRVLVGTMVDVARGKLAEQRFTRLLDGAERTEAGRTAPAKGLTLVRVEY